MRNSTKRSRSMVKSRKIRIQRKKKLIKTLSTTKRNPTKNSRRIRSKKRKNSSQKRRKWPSKLSKRSQFAIIS